MTGLELRIIILALLLGAFMLFFAPPAKAFEFDEWILPLVVVPIEESPEWKAWAQKWNKLEAKEREEIVKLERALDRRVHKKGKGRSQFATYHAWGRYNKHRMVKFRDDWKPYLEKKLRTERSAIVTIAQRYLGVPYVWGGASPSGFDCSGLTMYCYKKVGVSLYHGATVQQRQSKRVSLSNLKPGDLVFFGSSGFSHHVGIYVGKGRMIHAPHSGTVVQYGSMSHAWTGGRF